jgi:mannosyltransferase
MAVPALTGVAPAAATAMQARVVRIPVEKWILLTLAVIGAALRFATMTSQSYWFDEAQAVHELHLSFGAMFSAVASNEPNPPLYFVLAWPWVRLFGNTEAGLRSLSALLGTAVIPITYLCGRELISRRAALVAAALAALSPFMIWYSQEAREYMLLAALCGASVLFFARALQAPSRRNLGCWTLFSALAVLTQYFAGFLVGVEALWLLYVLRSKAIMVAVAVIAAVEATLIPHLVSHASHPLGWIDVFPLSIRVRQVPVAFGLGTLYQSSWVTYGLLGAAVLAGCVIVLLVVGADARQLRGAGVAAALAGVVLLVPLLLAVLGRDYYVTRALMPAWIPLAVLVGAACASPRALLAGLALAAILLGGFIYAGIRIGSSPQYQRPNWRGVAAALGTPSAPRVIVAYDGTFAAGPLAIYMRGVPWLRTRGPTVTVRELDVVGSTWQSTPATLPAGVRLISRLPVDGYLVDRFSVSPAWTLSQAAIVARAGALLGPAPAGASVLFQAASA